MSPLLLAAALIAALVGALAVNTSSAAAQAPPLKLVTTDTLKVAGKRNEDESKVTVFVANEGAHAARVTARFVGPSESTLSASAPPTTVDTVSPIPVTFAGLESLDKKTSGVLVLSGGAAALARPVELTPAIDPRLDWARDIVLGALIVGAALGLLAVSFAVDKGGYRRLIAPAPGPKWSIASWATTLTAAGAVFGTVLTSATFPEAPKQIEKGTLVTLNVLFGLLLVAGPFLFQALRRPSASPLTQEASSFGTNLTLVIASCLIFAAVAGEIATLGLLFWEILGEDWQSIVLWFAVVAEILAAYYFVLTIPRVAATDWETLASTAKEETTLADRLRMAEFARILHVELSPPPERPPELDYLPDTTAELVGQAAERPAVTPAPQWTLP